MMPNKENKSMPELPEVETVKRTLNRLIQGKTIARVSVYLPRIIHRPSDSKQFIDLLIGQTIDRVERRGKYLRFLLDQGVLVSHLRMEGRYGLYEESDPIEKHTHVIFHFTDDTQLRYKDVRQFGTMELWNKGEDESYPPLNKLGPEPLEPSFTLPLFKRMTQGKTTKIKPLLLKQEFLAGLGNIYVDEVLFTARIHPETSADQLSPRKVGQLFHAIKEILQKAVELGGSSVKSYVDGQGEMGMFQIQLQVYGKEHEPCPRCNALLSKMVVGGRGTHYCPKCQKLK
jgi:formamidopyrimidine-DNA glycosylase